MQDPHRFFIQTLVSVVLPRGMYSREQDLVPLLNRCKSMLNVAGVSQYLHIPYICTVYVETFVLRGDFNGNTMNRTVKKGKCERNRKEKRIWEV